MKTHKLKCKEPYFTDINIDIKKFDVRKNDRDYKVGDCVLLDLYDAKRGYVGTKIEAVVTYVTDYEQKEGFVVLGIKVTSYAKQYRFLIPHRNMD